jgi:hypothetical protein
VLQLERAVAAFDFVWHGGYTPREREKLMAISWDNTVVFNAACVEAIAYQECSFVITSNQPWNSGPTMKAPGASSTQWQISVDCGRKGDAVLATEYVTESGGAYHLYVYNVFSSSSNTYSDIPQTVNFYFTVTMTFAESTVPVTLYLAQVGAGNNNYWFIGGSAVLNSCPNGGMSCFIYTSNGEVFLVTARDFSTFTIAPLA